MSTFAHLMNTKQGSLGFQLIIAAAVLWFVTISEAQTGGGGGQLNGRPTPEQVEEFRRSAGIRKHAVEMKSNATAGTNVLGTWQWFLNGKDPGERWTNSLTILRTNNAFSGVLSSPNKEGKFETVSLEDFVCSGNRVMFTACQWVNPKSPAAVSASHGQSTGGGHFATGLTTNAYSGEVQGKRLVGEIVGKTSNGGTFGLPWVALKVDQRTVK
jgi:hypothetical protein